MDVETPWHSTTNEFLPPHLADDRAATLLERFERALTMAEAPDLVRWLQQGMRHLECRIQKMRAVADEKTQWFMYAAHHNAGDKSPHTLSTELLKHIANLSLPGGSKTHVPYR